MTLIDLLSKAAGVPASLLLQVLEAAAASTNTEIAQKAREIIVKFTAPLSVENLLIVSALLPQEALNILAGKLDPRDHPSDAA